MPPRPRSFIMRAEVVREGQLRGDVQVDDALETRQVAGDELVAVAVGAGVEDQQADLDVVGDLPDLVERVGSQQIERQGANLDPVGARLCRGLLERAGLAGDQHEVDADLAQLVGERCADTFGTAGDDCPRTVVARVDQVLSFFERCWLG